MTPADLWLPFLTGLVGGGHCIGMCGGFVLALGLRSGGGPVALHGLYNSGRLTTYILLGVFFGLVGSFGAGAGALGTWRAAVLVFAGTFMLLLAVNLLGIFGRPWEIPTLFTTGRFAKAARVFIRGGRFATFPLGLLMGLVPCGLVYTMLISAAAAGTAAGGGLVMAAFGAGTLPAMLGVGFFAHRLSATSRISLYRAAAVIVMVMGTRFILQGAALLGWIAHGPFW